MNTIARVLAAVPCAAALAAIGSTSPAQTVLVEAESFESPGGWVYDSQFMDQMGSPYLLAHGLGSPVEDATTTVELPAPRRYRVWVRTRDWVAPWNAPGTPGRFQLLIDGEPLKTTFGTEGAQWHWQDGGHVEIRGRKVTLALHDLTGLEGRCDAILLTGDADRVPPGDSPGKDFRISEGDSPIFAARKSGQSPTRLSTPPNRDPEMAAFRRKLLGIAETPEDAGSFDLVVVGGGIAGTCAATSAARLGLHVAFIQDRPVLGGNNSSEIRVWLQGARNLPPYARVGDVVAELEQRRAAHYGPDNTADLYEDGKKLGLVEAEKNVALFLRHRVNEVEVETGRIRAVIAQQTVTGRRRRFAARWVADCTGDGAVGFLAGADYQITLRGHMGRCNLWNVAETDRPVAFPRCPWALDLSDKPFPGRGDDPRGILALGGWYWESGFDHDPIEKGEYIRDWNFRAMYGAWDCLKNVDKVYPNHKLNWAAHVSGKRESRRLMGDVVLSKDNLISGKEYPDGCVPTGWKIDLHLPDPRYVEGFEGDAFIARAYYTDYPRPYWIPYRCLYSRNVENLFMAGRDISVTHEALGTVRVMRTGGCMGEVVGMAASLCKKHDTDPRGVYRDHLDDLKELMRRGVGKAPARPPKLKDVGENLAQAAAITTSGDYDAAAMPPALVVDGRADWRDNASRWLSHAQVPNWVEFRWNEPVTIVAARIMSGYFRGSGVTDPILSFVFQHFDGEAWQDIAATDTDGNTEVDWHCRFDPVTTGRVRLLVRATQIDFSRIWEIELYGPPARYDPQN